MTPKLYKKNRANTDCAIRTQQQTNVDMAATNMHMAQILQDHAVLSLLTLLDDSNLFPQARDYL